ncbi:MAG: hypothetical protein HY781_03360 [Chloroflexi bacterium]|nr:hypothetical protein [Chloroflexota bacterium]
MPFNEGWGQFDANAAADWLRDYDPSRPVDAASGFFDQGGGDCKSLHVYFKKVKPGMFGRKALFNTKDTQGHEGQEHKGKTFFSSFVKLRDLRVKALSTPARAPVLSEFGGYSLKVDSHLWNPAVEFGYKKFKAPEVLTDAYLALLETELTPCIEAGLSAAIYTQTTDVEIEVNGYVTYDRAVEQMDFRRVREAHKRLLCIHPNRQGLKSPADKPKSASAD